MAQPDGEEGSLSRNLCALLESGRGADVVLVAESSELAAHSHILAARSPVFAAMLAHDTEEARSRRVAVTDVRPAALRQLLHFMYTDVAPKLDSMAPELLSAADKYDLPLLKRRCERAVAQALTVDNAAAAAVLAELHSCPLLKAAAVDFIAANPEVLSTDGWVSAMRGSVEAAVEISKLLGAAMSSGTATGARIHSKEQEEELGEKLLEAVSEGHSAEMLSLLEVGAPVNAKDSYGCTALHLAVANSRAPAVRLLLDVGANVNAAGTYEMTPLHVAACQDDVHITWMLVAASADVNARDDNGDTPLHDAASKNPEQVKALLLAGAHRHLQNDARETPRDRASSPSTRELFDTY